MRGLQGYVLETRTVPEFSAFDLAQATEQVPGRFVVQLTFGELCDTYESAHPTAAAARLRKKRDLQRGACLTSVHSANGLTCERVLIVAP